MHNNNDINTIGDLIFQKLQEKGRSVVWLSKQVGCDESNLRKTLKNSRYIYCDLLLRISEALDEDFFVYYSQKMEGVKNQ